MKRLFHLFQLWAWAFCLLVPYCRVFSSEPVNLSSFGTVTASSEETHRGNLARHTIDGKPATRWCSDGIKAHSWLSVDLGAPCTLSGVVVVWENPSYAYQYRMEGSLDGKAWFALGGNPSYQVKGVGKHPVTDRTRHVRITHDNPTTAVWSSIREVQILGLP